MAKPTKKASKKPAKKPAKSASTKADKNHRPLWLLKRNLAKLKKIVAERS